MDTLHAIELFVATVQQGSFSAAGRQFGMSPATVSRYVSSLENRFGTKLLNRTSRALTLTEAGQVYFVSAQEILQRANAAESQIKDMGKTPRGTLRVHSRVFVGNQFIVPLVGEFLKLYPEINLVLRFSNRDLNLTDENFDLGIRLGSLSDSDLLVRRLGEAERFLVASPDYLKFAPPLETPGDIANHKCLVFKRHIHSHDMGEAIWSFIDQDGRKSEIQVQGIYATDYGPSLISLANSSLGLAVLPEWAVYEDIRAGRLVRLFEDHKVSHVSDDFNNGIYAVFHRDRHMAAKTRLFVDFLVASFKKAANREY